VAGGAASTTVVARATATKRIATLIYPVLLVLPGSARFSEVRSGFYGRWL